MSDQPYSGENPYEAWSQQAFDGMSLAEISEFRDALRARHRAGIFDLRGARRDEPFSEAEVFEEMRLQVRDIGRLLQERPDGDARLHLAANLAAMIRDQVRGLAPGPIGRLGDTSGFFVGWLINRCGGNGGGTPFPEAFVRVRAAVDDSEEQTALGVELHDFVRGFVSGEIDDDEWYRRIKTAETQQR